MTRFLAALIAACAGFSAQAQDVTIYYIEQQVAPPPTLSNLDPIPNDLGKRGAELALADNQTTGKFLGQTYGLEIVSVPESGDFQAAVQQALSQTDLIVLDAPTQNLLQAADLPESIDALLFNTSSADVALRQDGCRANLFHTLPSRAMYTDALMQFLVKRRWTDIALIKGAAEADQNLAATMERSAKKFGLKIDSTAQWDFDADMRRNAAQEVPLFTQALGDYDVLLVSDEANDFARYIPFNTWLPRPVAGSEGLTPRAWDRVVEQWGAAQLQSRFRDLAGRDMQSQDYAAWAAIRAIGEAVTRTKAADAPSLRAFMLSDAFELAGFKGRPLTFRAWNGQLRQPIALTQRGALVASAPLEGFLHHRNELDSLGLDQPESACSAFN